MDKCLEQTNSNISTYYKGKFSKKIDQAKEKFLENFSNIYSSYMYSLPIIGELFNETYFNSEIKKGILEYISNYLSSNSEVITFNIIPNWPFSIKYQILLVYGPIEGQLCIGL